MNKLTINQRAVRGELVRTGLGNARLRSSLSDEEWTPEQEALFHGAFAFFCAEPAITHYGGEDFQSRERLS